MKDYDLILFDLDGTLTDPAEGITNSVAYALKKLNITPPEKCELYKYIGPPLIESFMVFNGLSKDAALKAVDFFREYFSEKGIFENKVFEGIDKMLIALKNAGKHLAVATSKPEPFAMEILKHFGLLGYFDHVCGALMDETRTNKWEVIEYALECCACKDKSKVLMIGDRKHDIIGGKKVGVDTMGVLFGYGSIEEFTSSGADYIAESVEDITKIILSKD